MNGKFVLGILLALLIVAAAVGVGYYAYTAGVSQGLVDSGKLVVPTTGVAPGAAPFGYPYYGPFFYRPFGSGFGLLGCLFPLLFFFLIFGLLRAFMWRGRWGWGHHGYRGQWDAEGRGVPPMFDEWHKRAHGENVPPSAEAKPAGK